MCNNARIHCSDVQSVVSRRVVQLHRDTTDHSRITRYSTVATDATLEV